jgi:hypothetical protein
MQNIRKESIKDYRNACCVATGSPMHQTELGGVARDK